jgi:hypothetical protein
VRPMSQRAHERALPPGEDKMGVPEFVAVLSIALPILAVAWVWRAAHRLKAEQQALRERVDAIERTVKAR